MKTNFEMANVESSYGHELVARMMDGDLRTNAGNIPQDGWIRWSQVVAKETKKNAILIPFFIRAGLREQISPEVPVAMYDKESDFTEANTGLEGTENNSEDKIIYGQDSSAVPVVWVKWRTQWRKLQSMGRTTVNYSMRSAQLAAERVVRTLENHVVNGSNFRVGANKLFGLTTFPDRNTSTLTADDWDGTSQTQASKENIIDEINDAIEAANEDMFYGSGGMTPEGEPNMGSGGFLLVINRTSFNYFDSKFADPSAGTKTILQRIKDMSNIMGVVVSDFLNADEAVLMDVNPRTFAYLGAVAPRTDMAEPDFKTRKNITWSIGAPQPRSTQSGRCGIVHLM